MKELNKEVTGNISSEPQGNIEMTYGQKMVGIKFNPSELGTVDRVKQHYANIIDSMNELRNNSQSQEQKRLASVAITEAQGAQMWAVKALTWKD